MRQLVIFFSDVSGNSFSIKKEIIPLKYLGIKLLLIIFFTNFAFITKAQDSNPDTSFSNSQLASSLTKFHVRNILISGNKKTKRYIILREMQIRQGDSVAIASLNVELDKARDFIYNTTLFVDVKVSPRIINSSELDIMVDVKERWYIFPIPYVKLADRSFNEWIEKYNTSFKRLSYGIMFSHFNISGRRDELSLILINGFKRNISFEYAAPYINPALTKGARFGAGFIQTREIPYKTSYHNNLLYYKNVDFVKNEWYVTGALSSRKALKKKETFIITFRHINVDDSIISHYNPAYFNSSSSTQNFFELEYKLQFRDVDNILYPLKGYTASLSLKKRGLQLKGGINQFSIKPAFNKYFSYSHQWYSSVRLSGEIKLPFTQPYYNQKALGYEENYLRGDEYFAIDGVAYALSKLDLKKKIIFSNIPTFINSKTYNKIPFTFYAKTFADLGYVYSRKAFDTELNNKFLYSSGFGIDIVTLYDFKISLEYSLNQLTQKGLFLHL